MLFRSEVKSGEEKREIERERVRIRSRKFECERLCMKTKPWSHLRHQTVTRGCVRAPVCVCVFRNSCAILNIPLKTDIPVC